jgi:hypothetical protein
MDVDGQDVSPVLAGVDPPSALPEPLRIDWRRLTAPTTDPARFTPALLDGLPGPARRWLAHAIAPGTPLVSWEHLDDRRSTARIDAGGQAHRVTLTVADSGRLERVDVPRWGNPDGREFREHTFTAVMNGPETTYDGFTIPLGGR